MNAPAPITKVDIPSLTMSEGELVNVLQNSIYPGAQVESIKLVISYCKAQRLDPMQKPVHIVPMNVKFKGREGQKDYYDWRDVVMPGIGLYRTQAARTRSHAGTSEPEFGPTIEVDLDGKKIAVPEWCRVTVRRIVDGAPVEFTAKEFWLENYATAGKDTLAPNAMWKKRPFAQLAKCAEAQALRKGFPEIGAAPTAEEMEGKTLEQEFGPAQDTKPAIAPPKSRAAAAKQPPEEPADAEDGDENPPPKQANPGEPATDAQKKMVRKMLENHGLTVEAMAEHFAYGPDDMPRTEVNDVLEWIGKQRAVK